VHLKAFGKAAKCRLWH